MIPKQTKPPITYPTEPDNELLVWEKWVTIRKEETKKLGKHTRRPPADLAMNLYENFRPDKERKITLEEAKIKPAGFFDTNLRLRQRCYCEPVYEIQKTHAEMGCPNIMEHIAVPEDIKVTEMAYTGGRHRPECKNLDYEYHKYREKREKQLQEKILKIDPFRPEIGSLMIRGINPPPPPPKKPLLPDVHETLDNNPSCENLHAVYALRINNTVFLKDVLEQNLTDLMQMKMEPWHEDCTAWTYYFNVPVKRAGRAKLYLQNLGTVAIRYCWKKIKRPVPFINEEEVSVFFFNKNEDVLAPGQDKYISFSFMSDKPGTYKEHWELSVCNVSFFDALTDKLVVNLLADSKEQYKTVNEAIAQLKSDNHIKSITYHALQVIEDAVSKATSIQPGIYPYKNYLLEAHMFVMKNPVCFYHQTEVEKMKDYYTEMSAGVEWDLSIRSWREIMLKLEYDDRMKYYELLRQSHSDLLKPWYEGEEVLKSKYRAVKVLLGQLADKFDSEHDRITALYSPPERDDVSTLDDATFTSRPSISSVIIPVEANTDMIRNLYYVQMYQYIGNTMEACAGIISSLDMDRWIEFDFCRT